MAELTWRAAIVSSIYERARCQFSPHPHSHSQSPPCAGGGDATDGYKLERRYSSRLWEQGRQAQIKLHEQV